MVADNNPTDARTKLNPEELELIAELVDGVLDAGGRRAALKLLSDSPAAYEVYADAVATLRGTGHEAEGVPRPQDGVAGERPPAATKSRRALWKTALPLAAAAVAAALLLMPRTGPDYVTDLAAALGPRALSAGLAAEPQLSGARGSTIPGTELGRSFRLGVRIMDAEALIVADRHDEARVSQRTAIDLLDALEAPSTVIVPFRDFVDRPDARDRAQMDEGIETWLSAKEPAALQRYRFGKTSEALRFAIASDSPELVRRLSRRMEATLPPDLPAGALDSLGALIALVGNESPQDRQARMTALIGGAMTAAGR